MLDAYGSVSLPGTLALSAEKVTGTGTYLLDDGFGMVLFLGRETPAEFVADVLGAPHIDAIDTNTMVREQGRPVSVC
jgi:hypothetical protein